VGPKDFVAAFDAVHALDEQSSLIEVKAAARRVANGRAWCDAADVKIARLIAAKSPVPENDIAKSGRSSKRKARRDVARGKTRRCPRSVRPLRRAR
jgi:hypothetical protein